MSRQKVIVYLELEPPESDPVTGRICVDGSSTEFVGWLGLMDALAEHLAKARAAQTWDEP